MGRFAFLLLAGAVVVIIITHFISATSYRPPPINRHKPMLDDKQMFASLIRGRLRPPAPATHGHHYQMALLDRVHDSGRLVTHMGNRASLLEAELEKLKTERDLEQLAWARQRVDELEADNAKLRSRVDELTGRLEEADKELNEL
ncbi:hypothetical protein BHM03_00030388 [Ensete ventricosum]|nr:hypothetical protein BHM03_00030388 [Ensete ventricosum]